MLRINLGRLAAVLLLAMATSCADSTGNVADDNNAPTKPTAETLSPVYDDDADPMAQLDEALECAGEEGKFVVAQIGGNWCPWCLRFADFITKDAEINTIVNDNFVYVHINVYAIDSESGKRTTNEDVMQRLGNPMRFGYPVMVVLDAQGNVLHIQDSALLEEGQGYNRESVIRFFNLWTPKAVRG